MAPYTPYNVTPTTSWQPEQYVQPSVLKTMSRLPRYGYIGDISEVLSNGDNSDDYVQGIVVSCCCLLIVLIAWCITLVICRSYSTSWASGCLEEPPPIPREAPLFQRHGTSHACEDGVHHSDDTSSTSASSRSNESDSDSSGLSIDSTIFWTKFSGDEELTMAAIAREQRRDKVLMKNRKQMPHAYSTTSNGQLTLITTPDSGAKNAQFRVNIPPSLRLTLLRTYHDCLIFPDDEANAQTMIYEFFTWKGIRKDVSKYIKQYRQCMDEGNNAAVVRYGDGSDRNENSLDGCEDDNAESEDGDDNSPITLDVIAQEQKEDRELAHMMERAPSVFSTATNGSIQLITARGKDKKYRIVIPTSLKSKVLKTYHDCLMSPTSDNNFEKVLYAHFTWNGIHRDVEKYVSNGGTMSKRKAQKVPKMEPSVRDGSTQSSSTHSNHSVDVEMNEDDRSSCKEEEEDVPSGNMKPIGLDEIAKEQKKDKELRQLKKEEPFVFSTVRYGNTLLTTAQNFRDNKYRIVIPKRLQGRMLKTYRDCLLNPTPDRNFDTLLYNHFTWNGIHDDVDYFVRNDGFLPDEMCDDDDDGEFGASSHVVGKYHNESDTARLSRQDEEYLEWLWQTENFERKLKTIRIAFIVSGLLMIIASILFVELGVKPVFKTINDSQESLHRIEDMTISAQSLSADFLKLRSGIQNTAKEIGTYRNFSQCGLAFMDPTNDVAAQVRNSTHQIGVQLRDTGVRVESEMKGIERDFDLLENTTQNVEATMEDFKAYVGVAESLVIFIDVIVITLMIACILIWSNNERLIPRLMKKSIMIALLVASSVLLWIFSTAALLGAVAGADFCSIPDKSAASIFLGIQDQLSPLVFRLAIYYITGCLPERKPPKLETLSTAISSIGASLHSHLGDAILNAPHEPSLLKICGNEVGSSHLEALLGRADAAVHGVYDVLFGVREVLECHNINPMYTALVYDEICHRGTVGLSWIFFTSLTIAILSMVIVTLRAAVHQY